MCGRPKRWRCFVIRRRSGSAHSLRHWAVLTHWCSREALAKTRQLIRERICDGLGFLGIELDPQRNANNEMLISPNAGRVKVRVIRTDEELMIARSVIRELNMGSRRNT